MFLYSVSASTYLLALFLRSVCTGGAVWQALEIRENEELPYQLRLL